MPFQREDIIRLSRAVCEVMLDLPLDATEADANLDRSPFPTTFTEISGAWKGVVTVDCATAVASLAASAMFSKSFEELTDEDQRDAMLEIANVVGGNIKSLLPEPCSLSLPATIAIQEVANQFPDTHLLLCVTIPTRGHEITVSLREAA